MICYLLFVFFFNDTATTEIYTLSLHDALPILLQPSQGSPDDVHVGQRTSGWPSQSQSLDRKSTRLNSSHGYISYAVFCLKKKSPATRGLSPAQSPRQCAPPRLAPVY